MMVRSGTKTQANAPGARHCPRSAFTLIELLVVIVVIGVMAAILLAVGGHVIGGQKTATTQNTMRITRMAIDQFASEDPLAAQYDNPKLRNGSWLVGRTFGPFPPYQLANTATGTVGGSLEPFNSLSTAMVPNNLSTRLAHDLAGSKSPSGGDLNWVNLQLDRNRPDPKPKNDDIRALYAYMAAYSPGVLEQIPETARAPLVPDTPEFVNPTGAGTNSTNPGLVDVLGIYDAWGVPLDYFLYVRLEWQALEGGGGAGWAVTDRVPVLRSRGVDREVADVDGDTKGDWLFSEPFPKPAANVTNQVTGALSYANSGSNGWARARAGSDTGNQNTWDTYDYVPEP